MKVKEVIQLLAKEYNMDEHLMIDWVDQQDMKDRWFGDNIPNKLWITSCQVADRSEHIFDNDFAEVIIRDCKEKEEKL